MGGERRCVQVQEVSGRLAEFQDYYVQNRQMQLDSDLGGGPHCGAEAYQPFLLQVAGHFLLEERVRRTCPSLSAAPAVRPSSFPHPFPRPLLPATPLHPIFFTPPRFPSHVQLPSQPSCLHLNVPPYLFLPLFYPLPTISSNPASMRTFA